MDVIICDSLGPSVTQPKLQTCQRGLFTHQQRVRSSLLARTLDGKFYQGYVVWWRQKQEDLYFLEQAEMILERKARDMQHTLSELNDVQEFCRFCSMNKKMHAIIYVHHFKQILNNAFSLKFLKRNYWWLSFYFSFLMAFL